MYPHRDHNNEVVIKVMFTLDVIGALRKPVCYNVNTSTKSIMNTEPLSAAERLQI